MNLPRPVVRVLAASLGVAVLAACAGPPGSGSTVASPSTGSPGDDAVVLRITSEGGFGGSAMDFSRIPALSVLADGRVIEPAPVDAVYPGPLLAPLQVRRLTPTGLDALARRVLDTGVFDADHTYTAASRVVADATTTVLTFSSGALPVTVRVYALGMVDALDRVPDISASERRAHVALAELLRALGAPDGVVGADGWADPAWAPYAPAALRLLVREVDATPSPTGPGAGDRPVPGTADPSTDGSPYRDGRCLALSGAAADAWIAALDGATALTRFVAGGRRFSVTVRPLLPDEPVACPTTG